MSPTTFPSSFLTGRGSLGTGRSKTPMLSFCMNGSFVYTALTVHLLGVWGAWQHARVHVERWNFIPDWLGHCPVHGHSPKSTAAKEIGFIQEHKSDGRLFPLLLQKSFQKSRQSQQSIALHWSPFINDQIMEVGNEQPRKDNTIRVTWPAGDDTARLQWPQTLFLQPSLPPLPITPCTVNYLHGPPSSHSSHIAAVMPYSRPAWF